MRSSQVLAHSDASSFQAGFAPAFFRRVRSPRRASHRAGMMLPHLRRPVKVTLNGSGGSPTAQTSCRTGSVPGRVNGQQRDHRPRTRLIRRDIRHHILSSRLQAARPLHALDRRRDVSLHRRLTFATRPDAPGFRFVTSRHLAFLVIAVLHRLRMPEFFVNVSHDFPPSTFLMARR